MSVKSAARVLEIMELLADNDQGLSVKEISASLDFPQSSTFNIIQTMFTEGYLTQSADKRYKLGPKFIRIGTKALKAFDLHSDARPLLQQLMEKVEETVFMAVLSGKEIVYIAKVNNNRSIQTSAEIGSRKPLYCTGLGKAMLAFLDTEEREVLLDAIALEALTPKTVTNREQLIQQLQHFKEWGYAIDDEENEEGLYCYAAPIFDASGQLKAAISTAGPKERITKNEDTVIAQLLNTAEQISERLGYVKPKKEEQ
ncbi:IclR family transcriptional regulator [Pullulanibacillus camelliae]|uniref:IclR family transcriptional regulator n=1 Tax=Pullulanibacillus camelliae TaxID=1707096 RepID=A0A8J2VFJ5_9BACL|nr:IclR family transcriptional regulator [Pullulanibacillus camelliae]GGE26733.1 IclR family transcriptional regulator [Pullulanibacillus camelliae]